MTIRLGVGGAGSGELLEVASVNELVDDCLLDDEAEVEEVLAEVGLLFCCPPMDEFN